MPPPLWGVRPLLPVISFLTARYIARQRRRLLPLGQPIAPEIIRRLSGFFPESVLQETRVVETQVPSPSFYPLVRRLGIGEFPEMAAIGAITFVDLIAYPERLGIQTLFHEFVHVMQYRALGLRTFSRHYVHGFVSGGGYEGIPLERQAYELEERFSRNPRSRFSVEDDVRARWRDGRL